MPKKKKENSETRQLKVNIDEVEYKRGIEDKAKGWYASKYENEFMGYLVELGLQRYEAKCLPVERGDDLRPSALHDRILGSK